MDVCQGESGPRGRRSGGRNALFALGFTATALFFSRPVRAADGDRVAWVVSADGTRPAVMLEPHVGFLPDRALESHASDFLSSTYLELCTARGCSAVAGRRWVRFDATLAGILFTVQTRLAEVPVAQTPEQVRAAMISTPTFADYGAPDSDWSGPGDPEELPNSLGEEPRPASRRRRREPRPKMSWQDGPRWRAESGASAGLSLRVDHENEPTAARAGASARLGFRFRLRSPDRLVEALRAMVLGQQIGADLRVHYLGTFERNSVWAVTVNPATAWLVPGESKASVLGRLPALAGVLGIGIVGRGRRVSAGVQLGTDFALLVKPRFGIDFHFGATASRDAGLYANLGLGGFFR